jgi:hypothetical protein
VSLFRFHTPNIYNEEDLFLKRYFMKFGDVTEANTDMQKAVATTIFTCNGNVLFSHFKGLYGCNVGIVKDGNFSNRASF